MTPHPPACMALSLTLLALWLAACASPAPVPTTARRLRPLLASPAHQRWRPGQRRRRRPRLRLPTGNECWQLGKDYIRQLFAQEIVLGTDERHSDKVNWQEGSVLSPPTGWFHQHFNTGPEPARQLALRYGSLTHPAQFHEVHSGQGDLVSVRLGGNMIEYEDEDPHIRADYCRELAAAALPYQMPELSSHEEANQ